MKKLIMLFSLAVCLFLFLFAQKISLNGNDVIHYKYPDNFKEIKRYIRKGTTNANGDCVFTNSRKLKAGQHIFTKELAYNPHTCESLIVEGEYE